MNQPVEEDDTAPDEAEAPEHVEDVEGADEAADTPEA